MKLEFYEVVICSCEMEKLEASESEADNALVKLTENLQILQSKYPDLTVERYIINQQPAKFKENAAVFQIVKEQGKGALPIVLFNGQIIKTETYPTLRELEQAIEM